MILLGFSWLAAALVGAMALTPPGILLGVLLGVMMFFVPVANTMVLTYQLVTTPDRLRGRMSSILGFCSGGAGALGPLLGGLLADSGATPGLLACSAVLAAVALAVTASPRLRRFPSVRPGPATPDGQAAAAGRDADGEGAEETVDARG